MLDVGIVDEAALELEEAVDYLETERPGYGQVFLDAYSDKLEQIARFPLSGPAVAGAPPGHDVRAFLIPRFGYILVVDIGADAATIVAVAHHARKPGYWKDRLR